MATASAPEPVTIRPLLAGPPARGWQRAALFALWVAAAGWLAAHHVFWRDEVRALSLALDGDSIPAMLARIHGEGHPALWYLLLRGAHALIGTRAALPVTAFAIGAGAAGLWAWRAPFRPLVVALGLFGAFTLYEYTVSARNYGIAMLFLFAFAAAWPQWKDRGPWLGLILALLCNTNAPAVLLGEISCPTKYFPEASSINFRRSCTYGLGVLRTSLEYRLARWGLKRSPLFTTEDAQRLQGVPAIV